MRVVFILKVLVTARTRIYKVRFPLPQDIKKTSSEEEILI